MTDIPSKGLTGWLQHWTCRALQRSLPTRGVEAGAACSREAHWVPGLWLCFRRGGPCAGVCSPHIPAPFTGPVNTRLPAGSTPGPPPSLKDGQGGGVLRPARGCGALAGLSGAVRAYPAVRVQKGSTHVGSACPSVPWPLHTGWGIAGVGPRAGPLKRGAQGTRFSCAGRRPAVVQTESSKNQHNPAPCQLPDLISRSSPATWRPPASRRVSALNALPQTSSWSFRRACGSSFKWPFLREAFLPTTVDAAIPAFSCSGFPFPALSLSQTPVVSYYFI